MDFSWAANPEMSAADCASPCNGEEEADPAPPAALSLQEVAEFMILILVSGRALSCPASGWQTAVQVVLVYHPLRFFFVA